MIEGGGVDDQVVGPRPELQRAEMTQIGLLRVPQMLHESARGLDRRGMLDRAQAEAVQRRRAELIEQGRQGPIEIEERRLGVGNRHRGVLETGEGSPVEIPGQEHLPGAQGGKLVRRRAGRRGAAVLGDLQLSGGQVDGRETEDGLRSLAARCDRRQQCRFTCLERAGVGERAGRDHPHDFAPDDSTCLARVLHLLAYRNAKPLSDQAGKVGVGRMPRNPAHRDLAAAGVLGTRREGQLQGFGRGDRVLVEELVEVAHAKEDQRVGVPALGVQVLAHGRGGAPGRGLDGGRHPPDGSIA